MIMAGCDGSRGIASGKTGIAKSRIFASSANIVEYGGTTAVNVFAATSDTHSETKENIQVLTAEHNISDLISYFAT